MIWVLPLGKISWLVDVWRSEGTVNVRKNIGKTVILVLLHMMSTTAFKTPLCGRGCLEV